MNNYKELNFNFPVLRDDFVFPKECPTYHVTMKIDVEKSLHPELIKFFNVFKNYIRPSFPRGRCVTKICRKVESNTQLCDRICFYVTNDEHARSAENA